MTDADSEARPRPRFRIGVGAAVIVLLVAIGCAVVASALAPRGSSSLVEPGAASSSVPSHDPEPGSPVDPAAEPDAAVILVHILGEVHSGGLFEFHQGDRVVDAVAAAGGLTSKADRAAVNLARPLVDGEQIVVPRRGKTATAAPPAPGGAPAPGAPVNLNTADATALETLPGIGEALAARIIAWRDTNGRFTTVDDLGSVTGIGEKTLEGLRELVTV